MNAVKTALTGRTVLLPSDDAAEYQRRTLAYEKDFKPVGQRGRDLVHSIADNVWRLQRIRCLEHTFFSKGYIEFAEMFPKAEPAIRLSLIELHTFEVYEKKLRNLSLQEARLARREREIVELRLLQRERKSVGRKISRPPLRAIRPPNSTVGHSTPPSLGSNFQQTISRRS